MLAELQEHVESIDMANGKFYLFTLLRLLSSRSFISVFFSWDA